MKKWRSGKFIYLVEKKNERVENIFLEIYFHALLHSIRNNFLIITLIFFLKAIVDLKKKKKRNQNPLFDLKQEDNREKKIMA